MAEAEVTFAGNGRRQFLKAVGLSAAALALPGLVAGAAPAPRKPNFIFIYTDDQRWDALGVVQREQGGTGRFPWIKTPNMDRIANEGVRFRNAFVVNSLCAPSRTCFLTGRYSHLNGVANNHTPYPVDSVSHATVLRQAGYKTGYFGKFHMGNQRGQRPGFDFSASFIGQGQYIDCPIEVNGVSTPSKGWVDDVTTDYALKFIEENKDRPFSMVMGYKSCHGPRTPPERDKDLYSGDEVKPAENAGFPAIYHSLQQTAAVAGAKGAAANAGAGAGGGKKKKKKAGGKGAGKKKAGGAANQGEGLRDYFRTITGADDNIGRLLKALDDLKLTEDTVVIFASDNGFYLGEHGLGDKRSAYDESLRIPLLVRYPRMVKPGTTCDKMALNIDLPSTLVDLGGAQIPASFQGRSWRPLLEGKTPADWRKAFFYEYFFEQGFLGTPTTLAVRTEEAKLIKYPGHEEWTELFDLKNDPLEEKNLAHDAGAKDLLKRMDEEFERQAKEVEFKIPENADKPPAA